jgi:hypothetical protein
MNKTLARYAPFERLCAFILLFAYCFLSIAVFTGLHTHSVKGVCSLGNFDHYTAEPTEAEGLVLPYTFLSWLASRPDYITPSLYGSGHVDSRAPPLALFLSIL